VDQETNGEGGGIMGDLIKIDQEFKNLIPPLTAEEFSQLEANVLQDGCRDSLVIWNGTLIDGHNRYAICTKHGLTFQTREKEFETREDVIDWIINNQLGRRNITDLQKSYLRGLQYEREKKKIGANQYSGEGSDKMSEPKGETAKRLAEQHKVDTRTIYRDGEFAQAVNDIGETVGEDVKQKILNKEIKTTKNDILKIVKETPKEGLKEVFADTTQPIKAKPKEEKRVEEWLNRPEETEEEEIKKDSPAAIERDSNPLLSISHFRLVVNQFVATLNPMEFMRERLRSIPECERQEFFYWVRMGIEQLENIESELKREFEEEEKCKMQL
jgi:hypothetical protein